MLIGIDANPATRSQKTGTEWYTVRLVDALKEVILLSGDELKLYSRETLKWPFKRLWTQVRLSWEMLRRPPDVLFVPAHAVPRIHPKKTVTTIHDVGWRRYPQLYEGKARRYLESTTKFAVKHCAKILTPSEFTKQELITLYHASPEKIVVTPLAPGHHRITLSVIQANIPRHFFLTVSRMEAKKNITTLIRAFEMFKERRGIGDPFQLMLVGTPGFGYEQIRSLIARSPARESIRELGFIEDQDLAALMARATIYVYPSWYEGLGISALEAMAAGVPLIASDIPALHEAAGDAAVYFDPNSAESLAHAMTQLVEDIDRREQMKQQGLERVKELSWEKTAEMTLEVLQLA